MTRYTVDRSRVATVATRYVTALYSRLATCIFVRQDGPSLSRSVSHAPLVSVVRDVVRLFEYMRQSLSSSRYASVHLRYRRSVMRAGVYCSAVFVINRFFMKLFRTSTMHVVSDCQEQFNFVLPSVQLARRAEKFVNKLRVD